MSLSLSDGWMLLYHYGIVLSGAYVVWFYGIEDRTRMLTITFVLAVGWTLYFRYQVVDMLAWADDDDEEP